MNDERPLPPMKGIRPGIYRHYKGGLYQVFGNAFHSETLEEYVVYKHLKEDGAPEDIYCVRPHAMFTEEVDKDGVRVPRFEFLHEGDHTPHA